MAAINCLEPWHELTCTPSNLCDDHSRILEHVLEHRGVQRKRWGKDEHSADEWTVLLAERVGKLAAAANALRKGDAPEWSHQQFVVDTLDYQNRLVEIAAVSWAALENLERDIDDYEPSLQAELRI